MAYVEPIPFRYKGTYYDFSKEEQLNSIEHSTKRVLKGQFTKTAPPGLKLNTTYILKVIMAKDPLKEVQNFVNRDCYDLLDFKGDHLRKLLCYDDNATMIRESLQRGASWTDSIQCMTIEEYGMPLSKVLENCGSMSVSERLSYVLQYAFGLQELMSEDNMIHGSRITCARDTKSPNGVVFKTANGEDILRLIDFASIRLERDLNSRNSIRDNENNKREELASLTYRNPASMLNTCPEHVTKGMEYSEKTDIYALGMMLAGMFMYQEEKNRPKKYTNPMLYWLNMHTLWPKKEPGETEAEREERAQRKIENLREKFEECKVLDNATGQRTWIENDIRKKCGDVLKWENSDHIHEIRSLFHKATRLDPKNRLSLSAFITALTTLINKYSEKKSAIPNENTLVDLYIFQQSNFDFHRDYYMVAAKTVFEQRNAEMKAQNILAPLHAMCISYNNNCNGDPSFCIRPGTPLIAKNEDEVEVIVSNMPSASVSPRKDILPHVLSHTFENYLPEDSRLVPTGKIFLFAESVPPMKNMMSVDGHSMDEVMESRIAPRTGNDPELIAYYILSGSDDDIYTEEYCIDTEDESASEPSPKKPTAGKNKFYVGPEIPVIFTAEGKIRYAGFVKFK